MSKNDLQKALREVEEEISAAYWRFTRTSSSRVKPPDGNLYLKRNTLKDQIWLLDNQPS